MPLRLTLTREALHRCALQLNIERHHVLSLEELRSREKAALR